MSAPEVRRFDATIASVPEALAWVRARVPSWADPLAVDLGVAEALTNAITHGVHGLSGRPVVDRDHDFPGYVHELNRELPLDLRDDALSVSVGVEDELVRVTLRWRGLPCPPDERRPSEPPRPDDPLRASGRGMMIIHGLFDEVQWLDDGQGLRLTLRRPATGAA